MKNLILMLMVFTTIIVFGQNQQQEINDQVWKPFTRAIMNHDAETFISLHSKDLVRVERNENKVLGYDEYRNGMITGWPKWKESNRINLVKYTFELRFTERIANETLAYEVGYFKNESVTGDTKRVGYGKFHVTLRKEQGTWKILVDSDSNQNGTITEEMFQAAKPIE